MTDLKPENVMLVPDPEPDEPFRVRLKLLDFGIAKLTLAMEQSSGSRTGSSEVFGTPEYMSPEQCRDSSQVNDRTDVYSLGVILFQLVTGRLPFESKSPNEVLAMHMYEPVPKLSKIARQLPAPLIAVVEQLLEKSPEKRPNITEVIALLEGVAASQGGRVGPTTRPSLQIVIPGAAGTPVDSLASTGEAMPLPASLVTILRRHSGRWSLGLLLSLGSVVVAAWMLLRQPGSHPGRGTTAVGPAPVPTVPVPPAPAPATVRVTLTTEPPAAEVVRLDTNEVLGLTPLRREFPRRPTELRLRLQLAGHASRLLSLPLDHNGERHEILVPVVSSPVAPAATPLPPKPERKAGKHPKKRPIEEPEVEE